MSKPRRSRSMKRPLYDYFFEASFTITVISLVLMVLGIMLIGPLVLFYQMWVDGDAFAALLLGPVGLAIWLAGWALFLGIVSSLREALGE